MRTSAVTRGVAVDRGCDAVLDSLRRSDRNRRLGLGALVALLVLATCLALGVGAVAIPPRDLLAILLGMSADGAPGDRQAIQEAVLLSIRMPRALLAILVGASLATIGAALQGLFRNPLADPSLIGVSMGAALAAASVIVLGGFVPVALAAHLRGWMLPLAAFLGGLTATLLVYRFARHEGRTDVATMLLAGIAINAIAGAGIGFMIFVSDDEQLRDLNFWLLGGLGGAGWEDVVVAGPLMLIAMAGICLSARPLNALLLGETEAQYLGFSVESAKRLLVLATALGVGAAVSVSGVIGFVGLVVPHLARLLLGPDHRMLLPASILFGASLMLLADLFARTLVLPAELPVGIVTSCLGGPFFLWLLSRRRNGGL